jgi:hypothetical protein
VKKSVYLIGYEMFDRPRGLPSPFGSRMFWSFSANRFLCQIHAEQAIEGKGWILLMVGFWVIDLIDLRRDRHTVRQNIRC